MSSSFWYQTWRNWLINNKVLIIWTVRVWKRKIANVTIYQYTDLLGYHLFYTGEWLHLQLFKMYMSLFKWLELFYFSTDYYKFGIKMKHTSTCFPWYAFNLHLYDTFLGKFDFLSVQELFWLSVFQTDVYLKFYGKLGILNFHTVWRVSVTPQNTRCPEKSWL